MQKLNLFIKKFNKRCINKKYLSWINDKILMQHSRHAKINYNIKKANTFYKKIINSGNFFLSICDNYKIIGTVIVYNRKIPNLGILIGDNSYRGKGLAFAILRKVFVYLKKKKIKQVEIGCKKNNVRMLKIANKLKFTKYKTNKSNIYFMKKL
jgi:RimJ/RimL family protein N-acetyltransferase